MKKALKWIGIVLAALIIIPLIALLILGQRANAGKTHVAIDINAPRDRVWEWIGEGAKVKQWVSWMVDAQMEHGTGGRVVWVMKDENNGGEVMTLEGRMAEYQPPAHLKIAIGTPQYGFEGSQTYELTDLGGGRTHVESTGEYRYTMWMAKLMEPLITPSAQKKEDADLARLKTLVEAETPRASR